MAAKHAPKSTVPTLFDRAFTRHKAGDYDTAAQGYEQVLARDPAHAQALYLLGSLRGQQGRWPEAATLLEQSVALRPSLAEAQFNLGIARAQLGQWSAAVVAYDAALSLRPSYADAHNGRGLALQQLGDLTGAVGAFASAVEHNAAHADAWNHLGIVLQEQGHVSEAADCFRQAIQARPAFAQAHNNLGIVLHKLGNEEAALASCEQALALLPTFAEAHNNRGAVLKTLGRMEVAAAAFEEAITINPSYADAHYNRGNVHDAQGNTDQAIDCYSRALEIHPSHVDAHWNRSLSCLLAGRFAEGWAEHDWRWQTDQFDAKPFPQPRWDGSPLHGKSVLVYTEQGFGDTMQFARCLPWVKAQGAGSVFFAVQHGLGTLLASLPGVDKLVECRPDGTFPSDVPPFDVQVPLLSLPGLMGIDLDNIPAPVPFAAEAERGASWRKRLSPSNGLKVGLVWAGRPEHRNNQNRSLTLADFAPLASVPGVQFFSLQKGDAGREVSAPPSGMTIIDLAPGLHDFSDTAAALQSLDLLVCVDTSCAHLAGTLGVPTWTLLPFAPDWRWLKERTDTPWYPSLRLLRQPTPGDWASVFAQVVQELAEKAHSLPQFQAKKEELAPATAASFAEPQAVGEANPKVSIVIPCYKQAHFLAEAVRSVAKQTFTDWELIIVNDGSPDHTSRVAQTLILTHPTLRIRLIEQENAGLPAARNAGIRAAQGQYILPLDADDCLHPDFLARTVAILDSRPEISIVHTDIQHFGTESTVFQTGPFTPSVMTQDNRLAYCSLYRKEVWEKNDGYCEHTARAYEDWDFWIGALEQGAQAAHVQEPLFRYRKAEQSMLTEADKIRPLLMAQIVAHRPKMFLPARRTLAQETLERHAREQDAAAASMGGRIEKGGQPRILLVTDQFWPSVGGSERLTEDVALGLMAQGWQVEVMAAARPERRAFLHRGMRIQSCPASADPAAFMRRLVETRSFDCVLSFVGHWSPFNAAVAALPAGVRVIAVPCINADGYDHATHVPAVRATFARLGKRADVTARSSDAGFDARLWGELNVPTVYLPNAIDCVPPAAMDFRAAYGIPEGVPLLLHVGNFYREKNHAGLLNHLRARSGDWRLVLIGKPGHADTFTHNHAQTLAALDPRVVIVPGAGRPEVAAAMQAADILLLSSVAEATPLVLLEAMSHRLPWLATPRCGSAPDHAGGLVVPLEAFGDAIDFLMVRPDARQLLGAAGHAHWRTCYTWDKIAPRYTLLANGAKELPDLLPPPGAREETDILRAEFAAWNNKPSEACVGPAVSVIVCTHNRVDHLKKVLKSYETQTLPRSEWEVVVVNDGSTDGTAHFLQSYKAPYNLVVETLAPNRGLSAARNAGILRAQGEILIFQDDDDAATPDYLTEHLRVHRQHPETLVGVFGIIEPAPEIADSVLYHALTSGHGLYNYFDDLQDGQVLDFRHFWGNVSSVKKELLMQFGFFDPDTRWGMDDAELAWRLQGRGLRMVVNRRARLQAIRTLSFDEFCKRQKGQGRAASWLLRKHPEPYIPFWLNIANAEQRLLSLADGWAKVQAAQPQFAALEKVGLRALQASPGWESLRDSLLALCRIASEHSLLAGFTERQAEFIQQDTDNAPSVGTDKTVSIVIPCYNYARFLPDAIGSLVAQTYPHWEAVIVDDGSTDDSADVARALIASYPDHAISLIEQSNTGHPSHARNRGLEATDGPYVLCLDADDEIAPTFLAECVGLLERNPALSIAYTDQTRFTPDNKEERFYAGDYHVGHLTQYLPWGVFALFRRQVWADVGGWQAVGYEDWEFWLSAAEKGHPGLRIARPLARYRKHAEGKYLRDKSEGLRHKARLALHHPKLFSPDAVRQAEGLVSAYEWLAVPHNTLPDAAVSVVVLETGRGSAKRVTASLEAQTLAPRDVFTVSERDGADALNRAVAQVTGQYVAFLPDDAAWHPDHLATLAAFLQDTGAHLAYTDTEGQDGTDFDPSLLLIEDFVPKSAVMISRAALTACGGFAPSLPPTALLWDMALRVAQYGTALRLPTVTAEAPNVSPSVSSVIAVYEKHRAKASPSVLAAQKAELEKRATAPSASALNAQGVALWQQGDRHGALARFVQAMETDPSYQDAALNCADALHALGHTEDARALRAAWQNQAA